MLHVVLGNIKILSFIVILQAYRLDGMIFIATIFY